MLNAHENNSKTMIDQLIFFFASTLCLPCKNSKQSTNWNEHPIFRKFKFSQTLHSFHHSSMIYYALLEFLELCPCTEASLFCSSTSFHSQSEVVGIIIQLGLCMVWELLSSSHEYVFLFSSVLWLSWPSFCAPPYRKDMCTLDSVSYWER